MVRFSLASMLSEMVDFIKINSDSLPCSESCLCATVTADSVHLTLSRCGCVMWVWLFWLDVGELRAI